ncbi:hypothetical protein V8C44DRAFT_329252 [Trichoderma aethiopicum]
MVAVRLHPSGALGSRCVSYLHLTIYLEYETSGAGRCGPSRYRQAGPVPAEGGSKPRRSISDRSHDETDLWSPSRALGQQANGQWPITGRSNDGPIRREGQKGDRISEPSFFFIYLLL